jgi:hypothetical protein
MFRQLRYAMFKFWLRSILTLGVLFIATTCQAGTVVATLTSFSNANDPQININNANGTTPTAANVNGRAGIINWARSGGTDTTIGSVFQTFCIDVPQRATVGLPGYTFNVVSLDLAPSIPGSASSKADKVNAIERLWHGFYGNISTGSANQQLINGAAFQLAIWRIEYDWSASQTATTLEDFNSGTFQANVTGLSGTGATDGQAAIDLAKILLGDVYAGTPGLGYDVATSGLVALTNLTAQDQITSTPEPSTLCLGAIGVAALITARCRRAKVIA